MNEKDSESPLRGRASWGRIFVRWGIALPPLLLALATITGVGMERGIPPLLSLLPGAALSLLPALGLSMSRSPCARPSPLAAWLWSVLLLLCVPLYFPGERREAAANGLRYLAAPLGEETARAIGSWGAEMVDHLGVDPEPLEDLADREMAFRNSNSPSALANSVPEPMIPLEPERAPESPPPDAGTFFISYLEDDHSLIISIDIDGPVLGDQYTMIFDTGATFTTLDRVTLDALGLEIPLDAPIVSLQTANGSIEAPLVLVDAIWLGDEPVEWVTVALCDLCATDMSVGLLGLNVSQRFRISMDHDQGRLELRLRPGDANRKSDIRPWLRIHSSVRQSWDGGVSVELEGYNESRRTIDSALITLDCSGRAFSIQLDNILPHEKARTQVQLPRGTDCRQQKLEVSRAHWHADRF